MLDFGVFVDHWVTVEYDRGTSSGTMDGKVTRGNVKALLLELSNRRVELFEASEIISVARKHKPVKIQHRNLGLITEVTVHQHLADRHGLAVAHIPDDPKRAMEIHDALHLEFKRAHSHEQRANRGLDPEEVNRRAEALNAEHLNMLECDSCGYYRRPDQDGRTMHRTTDGTTHCSECKDEEEFEYV